MNTASNNEIEDFQKSTAPEHFELSAPASNMLLPAAAASISRRDDHSVELDWSKEETGPSTPSAEAVLSGSEHSVRRNIDRFPRSARAHANLGIALLKQGQPAEACKELETAWELEPGNYLAGVTLARLHLEAGRVIDAERWYEKLLAINPDNATIEVGLSNVLIHTGRYEEAHAHLTRAATLDTRDPYVRFLLGVICLQKSDLRCALSEFRAASNLEFRSPQLYHAMGVAYALQGDYSRAERAFKTALNLAPDSAKTVVSLARSLLAFNKHDQAINMLQDFLERHPAALEARDQLAAAYMQAERYSMARAQIGKLLDLGSGTVSQAEIARHHTNIGVAFMHEKSLEKAAIELKLAISTAPKASHIPYDNLARVYALTKKTPLAIDVLERAAQLFPASRETRVLLSVLYADQERYFDAIFQVEALRKFGPLSDDNYASLGSYYGEVELPEKAIGVLMEGYAKFPKSMPIINNLAYFLLMEGHTAQAKEILNARPHNVDDHVEMVATLGLLHLKEGDYDAARRLYKRAENLAARSSRKPLAKAVRQKMHLELARYHAARAEYSSALREIIAGLKEKYGRGSFVKQLKELEQSLQSLE